MGESPATLVGLLFRENDDGDRRRQSWQAGGGIQENQ